MKTNTTNENAVFMPFVDIYEKDESFEILADIPGLSSETLNDNLSVQVENGLLTIEAKADGLQLQDGENKKERTEFLGGKYKRSFKVSPNLNAHDFVGSYKNGVLHLTLPKVKQTGLKRVEIQSA